MGVILVVCTQVVLEIARVIREDFLQQNAFTDYDYTCPLYKSLGMLKVQGVLYNEAFGWSGVGWGALVVSRGLSYAVFFLLAYAGIPKMPHSTEKSPISSSLYANLQQLGYQHYNYNQSLVKLYC